MSDLDHENGPAVAAAGRRWLRVTSHLVAGTLAVAAGSVFAAGWLPIGEMTPWAQLVAFRPQLGVGLLVLAGLIGLVVRRVRPLCLALAVLAAASTVTLVGRVDGAVTATGDPAVTVLSSNVMVDGASVEEIVELAVTSRADAVVLPEASRGFAAGVAEGARRRGLDLVSQTDEPLDPVDGAVTSDHVATGPFPTSLRGEGRPQTTVLHRTPRCTVGIAGRHSRPGRSSAGARRRPPVTADPRSGPPMAG